MAAYYGARFADAWKGCDVAEVKAVWSEEIAAYGVDEIRRGIASLKTRAWPPTLPEFLLLCRPKPEPQAAHAEAVRLIGRLEGWSDPSVFWAAREIGHHDLKTFPYRDIRGRWIDALDRNWLDRRPIPAPAPVAGQIDRNAGKVPTRQFTAEERQALWDRINAVGKQVKRTPQPGYIPGPDDLAAMAAAEREITARQANG